MFLSVLSDEEKVSFARLLDRLAMIDGSKDRREIATIEMALREMEIGAPPPNGASVEELCATFATTASQRACLLELCCLAMADEQLTASERRFIDQVAQAFSLDESIKRRCLNFADTLVDLLKTGHRIVSA